MSVHPREQLVYIITLFIFSGMMMLLGIILMLGSIKAIRANRSHAANLLGSVLFSLNIMVFSICTPLESEIIGRVFDEWVLNQTGLHNGSWLAFLTMCYLCNLLGPIGVRKMTGEEYELHHFIKTTIFSIAALVVYIIFLSNQVNSMVLHTLRPHTDAQTVLIIITRLAAYYCLHYNAKIWDYASRNETVTAIKVRASGWRIASIAARFGAVIHIIAISSWSFLDQQLQFLELLILASVFITLTGFIIMLSPKPFFKKYMYIYHLKHWIPLVLLDRKLRLHAPSIYDIQINKRWKYNGLITDINRILIKIADIKREDRNSGKGINLDSKLLAAFNSVDDTLPFLILLNQYVQIAHKFTWKDSKVYQSIQRLNAG